MSDYESGLAAMILNCDFQKLQDEMASATKMACITVDYTGSPVTVHSGCTEFCSTVRNHPEFGRLCEKCDSRGGLEAARNKKPYMYVCHMGVVDVAIPIIYRNLYVGAVMCGQVVLPENERSGDIERIISEQSPVGFSSSSRMLYDKLTVMPKSDIEANVSLINYLCNYRLSSVLSDADDGGFMPDDISFRRVNKNASIIQPAINYMRENYSSPVKLHTLAELCDVSASYFSKLFKKVTGENLVTYLNRLRVEHGKRELLSTNKSVQAISKEAGFDDSGYFIKVFKAETGLTPNAFREKNSI
ncbi:MAG: PocR ligand-binding domain-containing protein [Eubacteriales bacterium]|nr:PocR ligand-binding domain-containing protein [Christensenellaceae bacterium]MDY2751170.1 PocR ligand-binding domain-containing protein [Eubacteriales bacterium]